MAHSPHTPHSLHAMGSRVRRSKARAMPGTSRCTQSSAVAAAEVCSASPMKAIALATNIAALSMNRIEVLCMRGCPA
jgi:hypothetical protein